MGEVTKVDTHTEAAPTAPQAESIAKMVQQAKTGVTSVNTEGITPKVDRPKWLPEKFKTPEDMAKSYTELEKKLGQPKQVVAERPAQEAPKVPVEAAKAPTAPKTPEDLKLPEKGDKEVAGEVVEKAGLKMDSLEAEYAEKGALSDASIKALEAAGIPKRMVDTYIAGQVALAERINGELHQIAGSPDKFDEMFQWSQTAEALSAAERNAVNKALDSKDVAAVKLAFTAVHAKWVDAVGKPPEVELRGGNSHTSGDVYTSRDALMKDMKSAEYKTNESFRATVAAKLKRSTIY